MKNLILFLMFGTPFILYSYCKESIFSYEQYLECYSSKIQSNNIIAHNLYKKLDLYDNITENYSIRIGVDNNNTPIIGFGIKF